MNQTHRKPLIALIALSAALAMPLAFAQDANDAAQSEPATQQQPTPTEEPAPQPTAATGSAVQSTEQSSVAAAPGQQGWNDVDADKDGAISKQEASTNAGLAQIFEQADADADGKLTTEEYKAFVAKHYAEPSK